MALRKIHSHSDGTNTATVYRDAEWDQFIVKLKGHPKADAFTDDKADAIGTAEAMVKERTEKDAAERQRVAARCAAVV